MSVLKNSFKNVNEDTIDITFEIDDNSNDISNFNTDGESPVSVEYENNDNLYSPARYSSATVTMLLKDYNFDLYAAEPFHCRCEIYKNESPFWVGFVKPNVYSQGNVNPTEQIEIECDDPIATLDTVDYETINGDKEVISLVECIKHCLQKPGCFNNFYLPCGSFKLTADEDTDTVNSYNSLLINEYNFFSDSDDDDIWSYKDVLEEIARYLNLTMTVLGKDVYFIDYEQPLKDKSYYLYSLDDGVAVDDYGIDNIGISQTSITKDTYAGSDEQIDLTSVYNKVVLDCDFYEISDIIPDVFDEDDLTNVLGNYNNMATLTQTKQMLGDDWQWDGNQIDAYYKWWTNPNFKSYFYDNNTDTLEPYYNLGRVASYSAMTNFIGSCLVSHKCENRETDNLPPDEIIKDISFTNYICLMNHNCIGSNDEDWAFKPTMWAQTGEVLDGEWYRTGYSYETNSDGRSFKPLWQTNYVNAMPTIIDSKCYIVISGTVRVMDRRKIGYIPSGYQNNDDDYDWTDTFLYVQLKAGDDLYWNGKEWITYTGTDYNKDNTFKLYYGKPTSNNETEHIINTDLKINNNISYKTALDADDIAKNQTGETYERRVRYIEDVEDGWAIPAPSEGFEGKIQFTFFNQPMCGRKDAYRTDFFWISNFKIQIGRPYAEDVYFDYSTLNDDTSYENVINENYTEELDLDTMRINTYDNKKLSYSNVMYKNDDGYGYVDTTYSDFIDEENAERQEEKKVYENVMQYQQPDIKCTLTQKGLSYSPLTIFNYKYFGTDKVFIFDGATYDMMYNSTELTILEKQ